MILHRSDGVIVTGHHTGAPPDPEDLVAVRHATELPIIIGSGISIENIEDLAPFADAFIVGSAMKENRQWDGPVGDREVTEIVAAVRATRSVGT